MSQTLRYTPDVGVQVHHEGAIRLICAAFQSHEAGLPEWVKNSADEYARSDTAGANRIIVLLFDGGAAGRVASIACLDFSGMTSGVIHDRFRIWADPDAAQGAKQDVQGGHGNGGKCYMTQMFEEYSLLHSVKDGRGCVYGVRAGSINFGYVPDQPTGCDFPVSDVEAELDRALAGVGATASQLPVAALVALRERKGFTLVVGRGPKGYGSRIPVPALVDSLRDHPQMIRTLEMCQVFVLRNGAPVFGASPIVLPDLAPDQAFAEPRRIPIPEQLVDPETNEAVSTTERGQSPEGTLTLRTSNVSMRYSRKGRHTIVFKARSGYIGYVPVVELNVSSSFRDKIYGDCTLLSLEATKQNDRARLARTPETRAVDEFIRTEIQRLADEMEARERRSYSQAEKDGLSKLNEALDKWKNQFLSEFMKGLWGPGKDGPPPPPPPLPSGTPVRINVNLTHPMAGVGVPLRPTIHFFDKDGRRIRSVPFEWVSDDTNVALVDPTLHVINTFSPGNTTLSARTSDGRLVSNTVSLQVVKIRSITLSPGVIDVPVGSRRYIEAKCELSDSSVVDGVALVWTEDQPTVASVSTSGNVFGFSLGETKVTAGDDRRTAQEPSLVRVVSGDGSGPGNRPGGGFPRIFVSGVDKDPDTDDVVTLSSDDPPVYQRPQDVERNVWWINSSAPLASLYLDSNRGYGFKTREWRIYHVERYIDVVAQIALTHDPNQELMSVNDWISRWGERVSDVQAGAAASLVTFIASGDTEGVA